MAYLLRIAVVAALVVPRLAQAHAILEDSTPAANGAIHAGPSVIQLRYNSRIDAARSRLILLRPDHSQTTAAIVPHTPPDILQTRLQLTPGAYTIRWQVLATDGHITRGDVPFTVTGN